MHPQRFPVRLTAFFLGLCMLICVSGFASLTAHAATSTKRQEPAKDHRQILPKKMSPFVTAPANTISIYENTTNYVTLQSQGCTAAHGAVGLIVLDWGQPVYLNNTYGVYDFGGVDITDNDVLHASANFAQGVWNCHNSHTNIAIAIGENNVYANGLDEVDWEWTGTGKAWASMVNGVQSWLVSSHYNNVVGANGAGDLEVEWNTFQYTADLVNGYNSVSSLPYFDFGDDSPGWWSDYQVWYIAYGATDQLPIPEIYYNVDATVDWEPLSIWACDNEGGAIYFKGTMAENASGENSPAQAFIDMYNAEGENSCTASVRSGLIFSTEIFYAWQL